jgi:hypothetical protein
MIFQMEKGDNIPYKKKKIYWNMQQNIIKPFLDPQKKTLI